MNTTSSAIFYELTKTAEWRQRKAARYPEDVRNLDAVDRINELLAMEADRKLLDKHESLSNEVDYESWGDVHSSILGDIGFGYKPDTLDDVLRRINSELETHRLPV